MLTISTAIHNTQFSMRRTESRYCAMTLSTVVNASGQGAASGVMAGQEPAIGQDAENGADTPKHPRAGPEPANRNRVSAAAGHRPIPPAVNLHDQKEALQRCVGIEPGTEEYDPVKDHHRDAEGIIPQAAADDECDIDDAKQGARDLDVVHTRLLATANATGALLSCHPSSFLSSFAQFVLAFERYFRRGWHWTTSTHICNRRWASW